MQFTLRKKLLAIFCFFLLVTIFIGIQSINRFNQLGKSIDVILRENYRSVIACQQMKEALERIDSGTLILLLGYEQDARTLITKNMDSFRTALNAELNNLTLPDETRQADHLQGQFSLYKEKLLFLLKKQTTFPIDIYFQSLFPLFHDIKDTADEILQMNQQNMNDANNRARVKAERANRDMIFFLVVVFFMAVVFMFFSNRWILKPIQRLIRSAHDITEGNLNLVVKVEAKDEIGRLSEAFNLMVTRLRSLRRADNSRLLRIQQATRESFKNLPEFIAIIDPLGMVEVSTEPARVHFGLSPESRINTIPYPQLIDLFMRVIKNKKIASKEYKGEVIQHFIDNKEKFFQPKAFPILNNEKELNGLIMILEDVTLLRQSDEIKKDLFSTVSHQLKTPLTSIRMAIHLLLEEKIGSLNEKQADLVVSARDESERLLEIIDDLLDISRLELGNIRMNLTAVSPSQLVEDAVERFRSDARDKGIMLESEWATELPQVAADQSHIAHVLENLLSNALKYTPVGGKILVSTKAENHHVCFYVADNGRGIPREYHEKMFEKFFRIPGQTTDQGEGLGLAIAKEIINAHDGEISVESADGKGTTFTFSLKSYEFYLKEGDK